MSVIFNALKKAEDSGNDNNQGKKEFNKSSIIEKAANKNIKAKSGFKIKRPIFLFLAIVLGLSILFFNAAKKIIQETIFSPKINIAISKEGNFAQNLIKKPSGSKLMLEGIIFDDSFPMAIINGEVLKTGEKTAGFKVLSIKENSVQLIDDQSKKEIELTFK